MYYFGRTYNATASAGVIKEVTCEKCHLDYFYQFFRSGTGAVESPYFMNNESAAARSQERAQRSLAAMLHNECEAVPCPQCDHVQEHMVQFFRGRSYGWLRTAAGILPLIGLAITGGAAFVQWCFRARGSNEGYLPYYIAAGASLALLPLCIVLRRKLLARGRWLKELIRRAPLALLPDQFPDETGSIPLRPAREFLVSK